MGIGLSPINTAGSNSISTVLTPAYYPFTETTFLFYQEPNNPWAAGQYITLADNTSGSSVVYYGTLGFVSQGASVGFYLSQIVTVSGTPASGETDSSNWTMSFAGAVRGSRIFAGNGYPPSSTGPTGTPYYPAYPPGENPLTDSISGDYYVDLTTAIMYGPKS